MNQNDFLNGWPTIAVKTSTVEKLYNILKAGGFKLDESNTEELFGIFEEVHNHGIEEGEKNAAQPTETAIDIPGEPNLDNITSLLLKAVAGINYNTSKRIEIVGLEKTNTEHVLRLAILGGLMPLEVTIANTIIGLYIAPNEPGNTSRKLSDVVKQLKNLAS